MPDIVPNLLHLSSEVSEVEDLLEPALDLVLSALNADAAAIVRAVLPNWSIESARGVARTAVPLDLAAEAVERGNSTGAKGWFAAPLSGSSRRFGSAEPEHVLLVRAKCSEAQFAAVVNRLADALA